MDANTYSYTIQPLISIYGTLHGPMLIILQEKDGVFGPNVMKKMKKCVVFRELSEFGDDNVDEIFVTKN